MKWCWKSTSMFWSGTRTRFYQLIVQMTVVNGKIVSEFHFWTWHFHHGSEDLKMWKISGRLTTISTFNIIKCTCGIWQMKEICLFCTVDLYRIWKHFSFWYVSQDTDESEQRSSDVESMWYLLHMVVLSTNATANHLRNTFFVHRK